MGVIPEKLYAALRPVTIVAGHYGVGKTNFAINLACDLADAGNAVNLVDLDIVNPYFRASEQRELLEQHGIDLVAPVFSEKGTSLDVPSLTGRVQPAIEAAGENTYTIIDVGGDDAGAYALGRFARFVKEQSYAFLLVTNAYRNLTQDPADAVENLREIEAAAHVSATAVVSNTHLKGDTTWETVKTGQTHALAVAKMADLPLVGMTYPAEIIGGPNGADSQILENDPLYSITMYVKTPWER